MIDALVDIVGAAIGLNVQTKHGLAQLIQGRPHVHVGEGQWKPIAQDTDGAWSYFRINGQMQVDSADIGMPCAGVSATVPLRYVALLKRSECDELPGLLVSIAGDIRATAGAAKAAIGAVRVAFPSIRPSIDEATAQELGSDVKVPLDRVLVTLDITAQIVGEDSCLTSCDYQRPVPCGTTATCADATYQLKDSGGTNIGSAGTIASGGSANITAPDATAVLKDSAGATLSTTAIPSNTSDDITAPDATAVVRNSVPTTLSTTAIKSGASQNIAVADSTITKPDGTTTGLPATVALDVRDYRSGIVYNFGRVLWSGQTASYRTGDEGYLRANNYFAYTRPVYPLRYAELSSWDTLSGNNVWGNTLRFTDRTGAAAATSGNRVIQDHFTGLEWYIPSSLPSDTTWNNAIDAAMASTVESSSDWRLPNDRMLDTITRDDTAIPLNYSPFNISPSGTGSLWTSTTDPLDTTQARRCVVNGGGGLFGRSSKAGNNATYIYCRKFL